MGWSFTLHGGGATALGFALLVLAALTWLPGTLPLTMILGAAGPGNLQSAEVREGRYFALDTTSYERGTVEISRSEYQAVLEGDQRSVFAIPGGLSVGAACVALAAGEPRRAVRAPVGSPLQPV